MLDYLIKKGKLARILVSLLLFFISNTLVFADEHTINIAEQVDPKVQVVESNDSVTWQLTNADAHSYDTAIRVATILRITFTEDNPTTGAATTTSAIDPPSDTLTEIKVTLKADLNNGVYPYTVKILDQFGKVLANIDPALVVFSGVDGDGNPISYQFSGNCERVTVSIPEHCYAIGKCVEKIGGNESAWIKLTDLAIVNKMGGFCDVYIEALTHPFSPRGEREILKLEGDFHSLDTNRDIADSTGTPIGSNPKLHIGPKTTQHFSEIKNAILDPKYSTTQLKLELAILLNLAAGESVYLKGSDEHGIGGADLVRLDSFDVIADEQSNIHLSWINGIEEDNAGFRIWRATKDQYGGYTNITLLEETASNQDNVLTAIGTDRLSKLIDVKGNSREGASYSYVDTCVEKGETYYYLLEDVDMSGKRTFHWDNIASATALQGIGCDYGKD